MDEDTEQKETQSNNMDEIKEQKETQTKILEETETGSQKSLVTVEEEQAKGVSFMEEEEEDEEGEGGEKSYESESEISEEPAETVSETTDNKTDLDIDESSAILDIEGSRDSYPKIVKNYRPEPKSKTDLSAKSNLSVGSDTGEMATYIGLDGRERTFISLVTQTDWDWVQEALERQENQKEESDGEPVDQPVSNNRSNSKAVDKPNLILPPITASKSGSGRELTSRGKTDGTLTSLDTTSLKSPFSMPTNDEFGIPLLDMTSSDDDSCSDDDIPKNTSEEPPLLPSIGPPQILQYIRESELEEPETSDENDMEEFTLDEEGRLVGIYGGTCEFCQEEIKPFPTIQQQQDLPPEDLYCCEQYREFVQFATTTALEIEEEMQKTKKLIDIKPHGHFGSKKARKAAKERAVQRMRDREMEKRKQEASGINSYFASPSGELGSATEVGGSRAGGGRREFKGSGPALLSYKDMDFGSRALHSSTSSNMNIKTKIGPSYHIPGVHGNRYHANTTPDSVDGKPNSGKIPHVHIGPEIARQMKTINYQLSSQKCLEEGWTKRAPTPEEDEGDMVDVFIPEPLDFTLANSARVRDRKLIQKNYQNGKKFLMIFPDGTGSVFYPSGYLAVSICKMDAGQYIYVVHDNSDDGRIMGVFEPNGHGCCYHNNGSVRLYFDQLDGIELDKYGAKKKKWSWKDQETHVHAPPLQPICIGLNRSIGLRVMTQENITVTFMAKNRSCRFNVGARLKLMKPENIKPKEVSDNMIFMEEKSVQIEAVLHKVSNLLRFPHSPKKDKILPPLRVTHRMEKVEMLRSKQRAKRQTYFPSRNSLNQSQTSSSNTTLPAVIVN